jgi:hypothetical protein
MLGNPTSDRHALENELLRKMKIAEQKYRLAVAEHRSALSQCEELETGHPDGRTAREKAARIEQQALRKYVRALKTFTDFVVYSKHPTPEASDRE